MAVTGVAKAIGEARPGEELERGRKTFMRTYLVQTTDPTDGPNTVLGASGLPPMGDPYGGHPTAVVVRRTPNPVGGSRLVWHIEVEWDTHSVDRDENPLNTRPEIEWGGEPYDEPLQGSAVPGKSALVSDPSGPSNADGSTKFISGQQFHFGVGITNAAGDPFDPPPTRPNFLPVVRFTRNEATFTPTLGIQYGNTVNQISWNGFLARQVWLKPIEATHEVQLPAGLDAPEILYWRVRYTFVLKHQTWDLQLLNIGPNYLDAPRTSKPGDPKPGGGTYSSYPRKFPFVRDGIPVVDLLKDDGTKYGATEPKLPTWGRWPVMREIDFAALNINLAINLNELRRRRIF